MMYEIEKPLGWITMQIRPDGGMFKHPKGLKVIASVEKKEDGKDWLHVSCSTIKGKLPTHEEMCFIKQEFIGDKYAYSIFPPKDKYVNISPVLHLWSCLQGDQILPEMSGIHPSLGARTI